MALNDLPEGARKALWDAGVPLSKAWEAFAHPNLKAAWTEALGRSAITAMVEAAETDKEADGSIAEKLGRAFAGAQPILAERSALEARMKGDLLRYIAHGNLHVLGYEPPRRIGDAPVLIPAELWKGRCDWDRNKLSANSLEIIEVRLLTNGMRDTILDREPPREAPVKAVGRPGVGGDIEAAFDALRAAGEIDVTRSAKSHFGAVRKWLHLNRPNLGIPAADISDETVRRHFSPHFNALKETTKQ